VIVSAISMPALPVSLLVQLILTLSVQIGSRIVRAINALDAVRVVPLKNQQAFLVQAGCLIVLFELLRTSLHCQVLCVALGWQHQAVIIPHLDKGRVNIGRRRWNLQCTLPWIAFRVQGWVG